MTGMLYHSSNHFSPISHNTHPFKTLEVQFEWSFLGEESRKFSSTAGGHKLRTATRDTHHPWEDILESLFTQTRLGTGTGALIISTHCITVIHEESRDTVIWEASRAVTWEKVRAKGSKGRNHPFEVQKVEIILSKIPLHHNTSVISLKYPSFVFQFDPTRINQTLTTRHIFDLDHFQVFPVIINFVRLSERDEVYQDKAFV